MPPITMLIKPASSLCDLDCRYCFYHDVASHRDVASYGIMTRDLLEEIVRKAMAQAEGFCSFAFQGGEPTVAGLDFFQDLIRFQKQYARPNLKVHNTIQTNGILIDNAWAKFFHDNHFLVGLSLDGDKKIHDHNRSFADGSGSFDRIMKTVKLFNRYQVEYNILCVVTCETCHHIERIYQFFKQKGLHYLQFIPCLDPLGEDRGSYPYSLTPDLYEIFLKKLFDLWYRDFTQGRYISIRHFDNWIHMLMGYPPESCGMNGICSCYFVIEADGSVYPCDFYVLDEYRLGSIQNRSFAGLMKQEPAVRFMEESKRSHEKCQNCRHYAICRGGCRRDRTEDLTENYFCSALYHFFDYAIDRMREIAQTLKDNER